MWENRFDQKRYRRRNATYLPITLPGQCECFLKFKDGKFEICYSLEMRKIKNGIRKKL